MTGVKPPCFMRTVGIATALHVVQLGTEQEEGEITAGQSFKGAQNWFQTIPCSLSRKDSKMHS